MVEIQVPPLRERMSDLPLLAEHLVSQAGRALGRATPELAPDAMEALSAHSWPGNVRELENCLMRAVVLASGGVVHREHLAIGAPMPEPQPSGPSLAEVERAQVARILAATGGNKTAAARILGVSRPRLDRLIRKYGLG